MLCLVDDVLGRGGSVGAPRSAAGWTRGASRPDPSPEVVPGSVGYVAVLNDLTGPEG